MRYVLILLGLMFANVASAMDCEKVPTCEELGYSTESDPNCAEDGYMYCPFDKEYKACVQYNCAALGFTESDKTSWCNKLIKCQGNPLMTLCQNMCEVGDVFYADGTCGKANQYEPNSAPEPVGVVFWLKDNGAHGKVVNLHDLTTDENLNFDPEHPYEGANHNFPWGLYGTDIPEIKNYSKDSYISQYLQNGADSGLGQKNTQIAADFSSPTDSRCKTEFQRNTKEYNMFCHATAAKAALSFYPPHTLPNDSQVGQGRWYLPALGELFEMFGYDVQENKLSFNGVIRDKVNATLSLLKDKGINVTIYSNRDDSFIRSITEEDQKWDLQFNYYSGALNRAYKYNHSQIVIRPILAF